MCAPRPCTISADIRRVSKAPFFHRICYRRLVCAEMAAVPASTGSEHTGNSRRRSFKQLLVARISDISSYQTEEYVAGTLIHVGHVLKIILVVICKYLKMLFPSGVMSTKSSTEVSPHRTLITFKHNWQAAGIGATGSLRILVLAALHATQCLLSTAQQRD